MTATATTVEVTVTPNHIAAGKPGWCGECPIALAICEAVPDVNSVSVFCAEEGLAGAVLRDGVGVPRSVGLPPEVARFVTDFDSGEPVAPFTFTLEVPS